MHDGFNNVRIPALEELQERVEKIEARQRANEQHDPDCSLFKTYAAQRSTGAFLVRPDCDCWLSEPPATT